MLSKRSNKLLMKKPYQLIQPNHMGAQSNKRTNKTLMIDLLFLFRKPAKLLLQIDRHYHVGEVLIGS